MVKVKYLQIKGTAHEAISKSTEPQSPWKGCGFELTSYKAEHNGHALKNIKTLVISEDRNIYI